ncbi:MAG: hypothetical protein ACI4QA_01990 [Candidatus Spyradosoma sp.]
MKKTLLSVLAVVILVGAGFAAGAWYFSAPMLRATASIEDSLVRPIYVADEIRNAGAFVDRVLVAKNDSGATLYVRFARPFSGTVMLQAFDRTGAEIGRSRRGLAGTTDEARNFPFDFEKGVPLKLAESFKLVFATAGVPVPAAEAPAAAPEKPAPEPAQETLPPASAPAPEPASAETASAETPAA